MGSKFWDHGFHVPFFFSISKMWLCLTEGNLGKLNINPVSWQSLTQAIVIPYSVRVSLIGMKARSFSSKQYFHGFEEWKNRQKRQYLFPVSVKCCLDWNVKLGNFSEVFSSGAFNALFFASKAPTPDADPDCSPNPVSWCKIYIDLSHGKSGKKVNSMNRCRRPLLVTFGPKMAFEIRGKFERMQFLGFRNLTDCFQNRSKIVVILYESFLRGTFLLPSTRNPSIASCNQWRLVLWLVRNHGPVDVHDLGTKPVRNYTFYILYQEMLTPNQTV